MSNVVEEKTFNVFELNTGTETEDTENSNNYYIISLLFFSILAIILFIAGFYMAIMFAENDYLKITGIVMIVIAFFITSFILLFYFGRERKQRKQRKQYKITND